MTILVTLKENIICPDGEEYRAIWGESTGEVSLDGRVIIGKTTIPENMIIAAIECERPVKKVQKFTETKDRQIPSGTTDEDIKHIYYSE